MGAIVGEGEAPKLGAVCGVAIGVANGATSPLSSGTPAPVVACGAGAKVGVARGSGVKMVSRLLLLSAFVVAVALESEEVLPLPWLPLSWLDVVSAELLRPASVGSGTGRKAKNNPAAMSAKIMAPVIIAPVLGLLPSSRDITIESCAVERVFQIHGTKANAVPDFGCRIGREKCSSLNFAAT